MVTVFWSYDSKRISSAKQNKYALIRNMFGYVETQNLTQNQD